MTGAELKAYRKKAGLSQQALADKTGVHRCAVVYWEAKPFINLREHPPATFARVLDLKAYLRSNARARGWGFSDGQQEQLERNLAKEQQRFTERRQKAEARQRVICGAKTRKGRPCRLMSEAGKRRCKFHGGMSTGPRTVEGRERIAEAQRERWKKYRVTQGRNTCDQNPEEGNDYEN